MSLLNRRRFLHSGFFASLFSRALAPSLAQHADSLSSMDGHTLFVGTQTGRGSQGIYRYSWNAEAGTLRPLGLAAPSIQPTFLTLSADRRFLFSANEADLFHGVHSGGVSSFRIDPSAQLTPVNSQPAGGTGTCYVGLDHSGRTLLCANYAGGSASSFLVSPEGKISPVVSNFHYTGTGPNHERQEAPHVHRATASPGNHFALFNDLGLDLIHIYRMDAATAKLTPHTPPAWQAPAGSGPRALRFHPNGRWAYCVTEMGSEIILLDWNEAAGTLTTRARYSLLPPGFHGRSQASEVVLDHAGAFLYAADRYYDGLYSFVIDGKTGALENMTRTAILGKVPRHITLDPTERWLLTADQDSDQIEIYARDPSTGKLSPHGTAVSQTKPQCLVFV